MVGDVLAQVTVPTPTAEAVALGHKFNLYWIAEKALALAIPFVFLFSGWGSRLCAICKRIARGRWFWTVALFASIYVVLTTLISLPLNYERHFVVPHAIGRSHRSITEWLVEQAVGTGVQVAAAALFVWIPYWMLAKSPRRWWLWGATAMVPVVLFVLVIMPVWVNPLTNSYKPLEIQQLASEIRSLAARCGVRDVPIVVGGDDTTVVGLGPTNRIVLQEDLAKVETDAQIRFTIGHELKHYVMGDNWKALLIISVLLLAGFWLTDRVGSFAVARWHARLGFSELKDPASLPLGALCLTFLWLAVTPVFNAFSQHIEREADRFGLELTRENEAAATMFAKWLAPGYDVADPGWFEQTFRSNHPSIGERIRLANEYHPWVSGAPLVYGKECKPPDDKHTR
ncbi:MAG: M48 family metalloprotease [Steroidobacteraceae bacterium]